MSHILENAIGVIGGSGLYEIEGFVDQEELEVKTPFGEPSDKIIGGILANRKVYFLPRHGKGHRILPHELNHRANIWALRSLGVRWIISVNAVGSLQEKYKPRDLVLPDQFFDRMGQRENHTFFGNGIVAHIAFSDPVSEGLRRILFDTALEVGNVVHDKGVYVNMNGPAFSTHAESEVHRKLGFDVVGMTSLPEAKLAREGEIAFSTMAFITDYDCWKVNEEAVSVQKVIGHLLANAEVAKSIIAKAIEKIPEKPDWPEHQTLDNALITERSLWPAETMKKLNSYYSPFSIIFYEIFIYYFLSNELDGQWMSF